QRFTRIADAERLQLVALQHRDDARHIVAVEARLRRYIRLLLHDVQQVGELFLLGLSSGCSIGGECGKDKDPQERGDDFLHTASPATGCAESMRCFPARMRSACRAWLRPPRFTS